MASLIVNFPVKARVSKTEPSVFWQCKDVSGCSISMISHDYVHISGKLPGYQREPKKSSEKNLKHQFLSGAFWHILGLPETNKHL